MSVSVYYTGQPDPHQLNLSGNNWSDLATALDLPKQSEFEQEGYGSLPINIIRQCATYYLESGRAGLDEGVASTRTIGVNGAHYIGYGREIGYLKWRAQQLLDLCEEAEQAGQQTLQWS